MVVKVNDATASDNGCETKPIDIDRFRSMMFPNLFSNPLIVFDERGVPIGIGGALGQSGNPGTPTKRPAPDPASGAG